jgi:hypothetical protein
MLRPDGYGTSQGDILLVHVKTPLELHCHNCQQTPELCSRKALPDAVPPTLQKRQKIVVAARTASWIDPLPLAVTTFNRDPSLRLEHICF